MKVEKVALASVSKSAVQDALPWNSMKALFAIANNWGLKGVRLTDLVLEDREQFKVFLCDMEDDINFSQNESDINLSQHGI